MHRGPRGVGGCVGAMVGKSLGIEDLGWGWPVDGARAYRMDNHGWYDLGFFFGLWLDGTYFLNTVHIKL